MLQSANGTRTDWWVSHFDFLKKWLQGVIRWVIWSCNHRRLVSVAILMGKEKNTFPISIVEVHSMIFNGLGEEIKTAWKYDNYGE